MRYIIILLVLLPITAFSGVKEYYITCNPDSLKYIYDNPYEDHYIDITFEHAGKTWDGCKMRIRGDGTRMWPKKSLKIVFDNEPFETGREKINFNSEYESPCYMSQYLSSRLYRESGHNCFNSEHARVFANGKFLGLYLMIENIDAQFLESRGLDPKGNLYKATRNGASMSDMDDIYNLWEKKTNESTGWDDLVQMIHDINSVPDDQFQQYLKENFEYDKVINLLAMNMLIANASTYYHNYHLFHDINESNKWQVTPWDMDKTFWIPGYPFPYHHSASYYENDNPLPERSWLTKAVFDDVKDRVNTLASTIFNENHIFPIIDSLKAELKASVEEDGNDRVESLDVWYQNIDRLKNFVSKRYDEIQYQFSNFPSSFKANRTPGIYKDEITFTWSESVDPKGGEVSYRLYYNDNPNLDASVATVIKDIKGTSYTLDISGLKDGVYSWMIVAWDGTFGVEGFDNKNTFIKKSNSGLPCDIEHNMTLTKSGSPYLIDCGIKIHPGAELTVEKGVELRFENGMGILVNGSLKTEGTFDEPVKLIPNKPGYALDSLTFLNSTGKNHLKGLIIENVQIRSYDSEIVLENSDFNYGIEKYGVMIEIWNSDNSRFINSKFKGSNTGECVFFANSSNITVDGCTFEDFPDPVEYSSVSNGMIKNNIIRNSNDDGIDINGGKSVSVESNRIFTCSDKGISIGADQEGPSSDIIISRNLITDCANGIAVKDESEALIINNTLYNNNVSIACFEKISGIGGASAIVKNTILANSKDSVLFIDAASNIDMTYCLSDTKDLAGQGNLFDDPGFINPEIGNFNLNSDSPCIDAGDPETANDIDGTRADIGAFPFNQSYIPIVINEINYNSSAEFDPGDWVELYNPGEDTDMSGWYFMDESNDHKYTFPAGTIIGGDNYLVLCDNSAAFSALFPGISNYIGDLGFGLSGSGELIRLYNNKDKLIDSLTYDDNLPWPEEPDGNGPTLELTSYLLDNSKAQSWTASTGHGTPGSKNGSSTFVHHESIYDLSISPVPADGNLKLTFNSNLESLANFAIYDISGMKFISGGKLNVSGGKNLYSINTSGFSPGVYLLIFTINGISSNIPFIISR